MDNQTLIVSKAEALILELMVTTTLVKLEEEYSKNKDEEGYNKTNALSEITLFKGLKKKVDSLEMPDQDYTLPES